MKKIIFVSLLISLCLISMSEMTAAEPSKGVVVAKEAAIEDLPDKISANSGNPYFGMGFAEQSLFLPKFQRGKVLKEIVFWGASSGTVRLKVTHGNKETISKDFSFAQGKNTLTLNWQLYDNVTNFNFAIVSGTLYANKSKAQSELGMINYRWDGWSESKKQNWSLGLGIYLEDAPDKIFEGEIVVARHASIGDLPDRIESNPSDPYFSMGYSDSLTFLDQFQGGKRLKRIVFFGASEGKVRVEVVHNGGDRIVEDFDFVEGKNILDINWLLAQDVTDFNFSLISGALCANKCNVQPELGAIGYRWDKCGESEDRNWSIGLGVYLEEVNYRQIVVAKEPRWEDLPDVVSGNPGNPYFSMWYYEKDKFISKFKDNKILRRIVFYGVGPGKLRLRIKNGGQTKSEDFQYTDGRNELNLNWVLTDDIAAFDVIVVSGAIRANKSQAQPELGKLWYRFDGWAAGQVQNWSLGLGIYIEDVIPSVPNEGETVPIWIHEYQNSINAPGTREFYHTLIDNQEYEAVRIGEYLWMNRNLNSVLPHLWAEPWNPATSWIGESAQLDITQELLNRDLDRLKVDKSQFQIEMEDFHTYYGRYYTRPEVNHFDRKRGAFVSNNRNLNVYETPKKIETNWKMPLTSDFRQLFAMVTMPSNGVLGQIAVRIALSCRAGENPLAYDIYDPKGGMNYRTSWFEISNNELGFNMMPGGSRLNGDGLIDNGIGPLNGKWEGKKGDIYHLFHTAKYATADSQVSIHDYLSTGISDASYHWYNVRFCRELTPKELGYKLYINQPDYKENYEYTILKLQATNVDIKKVAWDAPAPEGYYELPKGYLRGLYVNHILDKAEPKSIEQIVTYLKKIDDDLFHAPNRMVENPSPDLSPEPSSDSSPEIDRESSVAIYPTLTEQYLNVNCSSDEVMKSINIYSLTGSKNLSYVRNLASSNRLDLATLSQGVYVVAVETDKGRFSFKIIKQ